MTKHRPTTNTTTTAKRSSGIQYEKEGWIDEQVANTVPDAEAQATAPEVAPPVSSTAVVHATVSIPLAVTPRARAHVARHHNFTLDRAHAVTLRRVFDALHDAHVKLSNGRHVDRPADAVRWLLEQAATQLTND